MFDQTFIEDHPQAVRKPYSVLLSTLLQTAAVCLLILAPLLYTQTLPNAQLRSMLMAPPPPSTVPKPRVITPGIKVRAVRTLSLAKITAPVAIPKQISQIDDAPAAPDLAINSSGEGNSPSGNPLLFASSGPAAPIAAAPPLMTQTPNGPVRIGGTIAEANLTHRVNPAYPPLAKSARIQGTVEFTAIISKDGSVQNLKLISGHPLLVNAARDAILQWRYRPTRLNGEPVEVMTTITVHFRLSM